MNCFGSRKPARRALWQSLWLILAVACTPMTGPSAVPDRTQTPSPPELLDSFAVSSQWAGETWRIYVEGRDADGDMKDIWVVVSQLGGNMWSNQFVSLKGDLRRAFSGYIALPTPRVFPRGGWETVRVELKIRDQSGYYSQARIQEVQIGSPTRESIPEKWRDADHRQLGTIFFDFDLDQDNHQEMRRR
jgi:hypothetical protein